MPCELSHAGVVIQGPRGLRQFALACELLLLTVSFVTDNGITNPVNLPCHLSRQERLAASNRQLKQWHRLLVGKVAALMSTDLVRHKDK